QRIVQQLIRSLPPKDLASAETLAGELRWQFRLTILVLINSIATAFAIMLLWRAYQSSQVSLRDFKALAADILSSMDQAVITTDENEQVTSLNSRAKELLGISRDFTGTPLACLTDQIDLPGFCQLATAQGHAPFIKDFQVATSNGPHWLRTFCQPLRDINNATIGNVIQLRDVTEQVHVENQMRRMERFMGLGSLAVGLHHEIKNPLAGLSLHVQLLEEHLRDEKDPEEVKMMLGVIKTEVNRIGSVLENFRDFASIGNLNHHEVVFSELVDQQATLIRPQAEAVGIVVNVVRDTVPIPPMVIDRDRIEQVILNLMLNAIHAMPGGGELTILLRNTELTGERAVAITVSDTGAGIPDNIAERVFDPYFTTKSDGTGMGLALSDKIVRQHGGELTFQSSSKGSQFTVTLPATAQITK
ncbi:MAG: ATP-binding protein, partial [Rubripirellula sp.]